MGVNIRIRKMCRLTYETAASWIVSVRLACIVHVAIYR